MIVAAVGLRREARLLAATGATFVVGGGDTARLEAALDALAPAAAGLISLGIAGALAPGLCPGDWVVASGVRDGTDAIPTDPEWTDRLTHALGASLGPVFGTGAPVAEAAAKAALRRDTGALTVDMESHVLARVARRHGRPFAVARAISDAADRSLPPAARVGMRGDGGMDIPAVLRSLAALPGQFPALVATGLAAERGFRALARFPRDLLRLPERSERA